MTSYKLIFIKLNSNIDQINMIYIMIMKIKDYLNILIFLLKIYLFLNLIKKLIIYFMYIISKYKLK